MTSIQLRLSQGVVALAFAAAVMACVAPAPDSDQHLLSRSQDKADVAQMEYMRLYEIFMAVGQPSHANKTVVERRELVTEVRRLGIESGHEKAAEIALDIFSAMKNDSDEFVRREVVHGACWVGSLSDRQKNQAGGVMKEMMNDPDEDIRNIARECIDDLKL